MSKKTTQTYQCLWYRLVKGTVDSPFAQVWEVASQEGDSIASRFGCERGSSCYEVGRESDDDFKTSEQSESSCGNPWS